MSANKGRKSPDGTGFLAGGGEMAELIRRTDWSRTALGPIDQWPQSLRTTVSLCLASNFPINIIWGPEHLQIYNDGYRVVCGDAHPTALGEPYTQTWASAWPAIGEPFEHALKGKTSFLENQRMFLFRNGYLEETFFTFSLSPIRDESGGIGGLFHPVTETTASMLAERRTRCLRDLNARLGDARTAAEVFAGTLEISASYELDLPFVALYALDGETYRLAGRSGLDLASPAAPVQMPVAATAPWPVKALIDNPVPLTIDNVAERVGPFPCGPYEEPPTRAVGLPIVIPGPGAPAALAILGVSPRLPFDETYRSFYSLLSAAIAAGLANARTYEDERRRLDMLAELDLAKTAFFSNVSHEFRTPLTLMLGPIEDALAGPLEGDQRARLEVAHRNALRLLKLVNSLLDFSRIEAGRLKARFEPTDLAALTADLASSFRSACERAGLDLRVDCPALAETVFVDRDLWEKVVLNLISNAFKFTLEGEIAVSLAEVDDGVELTVRDSGVGISADELPRVMERFHRIEGQKGRTHEGSGIGLALVDELVKLHGGEIVVESRLGEGSTFRVRLPHGRGHLPADQVAADTPLASTAVGANAYVAEALRWLPDAGPWDKPGAAPDEPGIEGRPRVVLADDNADMRAYVARLLSDAGYEVDAVSDGLAALEAVRRGPAPDLVLSDIMMPRLDGFGLLAALRADPELDGLLVILLSARAGEEARVEGLAAGADDYLVKPFSARELRARVDGAVRLARQRRDAAKHEQALRLEIADARSRAALRRSEGELAFTLEAGRLGSWTLDLLHDRFEASALLHEMLGVPVGERLERRADAMARVHPEDRAAHTAAVSRVIAAGGDLETEFRILSPDGAIGWIMLRGRADHDADGRPVRLAGVAMDITARKRAEERQTLLLHELNHRVKNTLATVQSLTFQTAARAAAPPDFLNALQARIIALAEAHDLLAESAWEGAALADVVERTLAPYVSAGGGRRVAFSGPAVRLRPNAAVTLNMAFHELATNAAKYGALSAEGGCVDITWRTDLSSDPRAVEIEWREHGGPAVAPRTQRGFGSRLIEDGLARELSAQVDLTFPPEGARCRMRLPLGHKLRLAA